MNEKYLLPLSLLISSIIIGVGIYFTYSLNQKEIQQKDKLQENNTQLEIKKVDVEKDHIQGSKTADVFIIEYADLECIGCKSFSKLENDLIKKYKDNPRVAFVFRQFPLYKTLGKSKPRHPSAGVEAMATECVSKLAGKEYFFKMRDKIFETTKSDGKYPVENLAGLAEEFGVNEKDFNDCIDSDEIKEKIENAWQEAIDEGINATPSVFIQIKPLGQSFKLLPSKKAINDIIQAYLNNN